MVSARLVACFSVLILACVTYVATEKERRADLAAAGLDMEAGADYDAPYADQVSFVCAYATKNKLGRTSCLDHFCHSLSTGTVTVDTKLKHICADGSERSVSFADVAGEQDWYAHGLNDPQCPARAGEETCALFPEATGGLAIDQCDYMGPYVASTVAVEHWRFVNKAKHEVFQGSLKAVCADANSGFGHQGCQEALAGFKPTRAGAKYFVECPDDLGSFSFDLDTLLAELDQIVLANGGEAEVKALLYGKCSTDRRLGSGSGAIPFNKAFGAEDAEIALFVEVIEEEEEEEEEKKEEEEEKSTTPCFDTLQAHGESTQETVDCAMISATDASDCTEEETIRIQQWSKQCETFAADRPADCVSDAEDPCAEGADASCSDEDKARIFAACKEDDSDAEDDSDNNDSGRRSLKAMLRDKGPALTPRRDVFDFMDDEAASLDEDGMDGQDIDRGRKLYGRRRRRWHGHWPHGHLPHGHLPHGHLPHGHLPHVHVPHEHRVETTQDGHSGQNGIFDHDSSDIPSTCEGCAKGFGNVCFGRCGPGCSEWNACGNNGAPAFRACWWHDSFCGFSMLNDDCIELLSPASMVAAMVGWSGGVGNSATCGTTANGQASIGGNCNDYATGDVANGPFSSGDDAEEGLCHDSQWEFDVAGNGSPARAVHWWGSDSDADEHYIAQCDVCDRMDWGAADASRVGSSDYVLCDWDATIWNPLSIDCCWHDMNGFHGHGDCGGRR